MSHGLSLLREKDRGRLPLLSPSLFVMAVLFGAMQPEFDPEEVWMWVVLGSLMGSGCGLIKWAGLVKRVWFS